MTFRAIIMLSKQQQSHSAAGCACANCAGQKRYGSDVHIG